jgi:hypothetical protein
VLEAVFILLEFRSPSRRIFIGSHSLPPSLVRRIGPSGVPSLSFRLERIQQIVPYEQIRELLGFQKGAPEKVDVSDGMLDGLWILISGEAHQQ